MGRRRLRRSYGSRNPPSQDLDALTAHRCAIEAVVSDLDGVLVDTESWWDGVGIAVATGMSRRWTEAPPEIEIACGYIRAGITKATLNRS